MFFTFRRIEKEPKLERSIEKDVFFCRDIHHACLFNSLVTFSLTQLAFFTHCIETA